jgi:hypothetical protein
MPEKEIKGYRIRNWSGHFEISQSRRRPDQKNSWVAFPNKHDGKTFRRITREPEAERLFCAWCLIVEVASKCIPRGDLRDPDGWLTPDDLADKTGFRPDLFALALPFFASPRIAWLEAVQVNGAAPGQTAVSPEPDRSQTSGLPGNQSPGKGPEMFEPEGLPEEKTQIGRTAVRPQSDRGQATLQTRQTIHTAHTQQPGAQELISEALGILKTSESSLTRINAKDLEVIVKAFPGLDLKATILKAIPKGRLVNPRSPAPWLFSFFEHEATPRKGLSMYELKQKQEALQTERTRLQNYPDKNRAALTEINLKIKEVQTQIRNFGEGRQ